MNQSPEGGGGFARRMSALARKGRSRRREPAVAAAPPAASAVPPSPSSAAAGVGATAAAAYVNEGLERWNAQHREWCTGRTAGRTQGTARRRRGGGGAAAAGAEGDGGEAGDAAAEPMDDSGVEFDSDDLYNELLSPQYATRWPKRVKLSKLVEVLVDVWESDGT